MPKRPSVAVIGAGIAGLAAARRMTAAGVRVTLFDKSRGLGGRMATRRTDGFAFDHGTQYFTVSDPGFRAEVEAAEAAGAVAPWPGLWARWSEGALHREAKARVRYVGVPGMSAFCRHLGEGHDMLTERTLRELGRADGGWEPVTQRGPLGETFDAVAVAVPAPQARALLDGACSFADRLGTVDFAPCWSLLAGFAAPLGIEEDGIEFGDDPLLAWAARDSSKPRRSTGGHGEAWVVHATPAWSRANLERPAEEVAAALLERFREVFSLEQEPAQAFAHRWVFSLVERPVGEPFLWDPAVRLGACGDWCLGGRVEEAWRSGDALGAAMAGHLLE